MFSMFNSCCCCFKIGNVFVASKIVCCWKLLKMLLLHIDPAFLSVLRPSQFLPFDVFRVIQYTCQCGGAWLLFRYSLKSRDSTTRLAARAIENLTTCKFLSLKRVNNRNNGRRNEIKQPYAKYCQLDIFFLQAAQRQKQSCSTLWQLATDPSTCSIKIFHPQKVLDNFKLFYPSILYKSNFN